MTDVPYIVTATWLRDHSARADVKILDASSHLPTTGRDADAEFIAQHIFCLLYTSPSPRD